MEKIKVLHLFSSSTIGGAEKQTLFTATNLKQYSKKFEPILAVPKGTFLYEQGEQNNIKVIDFSCRGAFTPTGVFRLINIIRKEKISILHVHQGKLYWTALLMKLFFKNLKVVLHRRQDTRHKWYAKWHYKIADKTLTVSKAVRNNLLKYEHVPENKVEVLYNAFNFENFTKNTDCTDIIKKYNLKDKIVIGTVAAIVSLEGKGQQYLLEAISQLRTKYPNIVGLFVGDGVGRSLQEKYAKSLGVDDIVYYVGQQSNVAKYVNAMNIFCLLSCDTEGFGNVNLEAQSLQKPVITTTVGGNPETIIDNKTGILIEPRNTQQLIDAIEKIINNKQFAQSIAQEGVKFVKETFSRPKYVENLEKIYEQILND